MHGAFLNELVNIEPVIKDENKLEALVLDFVREKMADRFEEQEGKVKTIKALKSKILSLEERYVDGELDKELYQKYRQKHEQEIREMEAELGKSNISSSNLELAVKKGISILCVIIVCFSNVTWNSQFDEPDKIEKSSWVISRILSQL